MNDMIFQKKVVLVTGGSRGIGAAVVEEFINQGATVYSLSRSPGEVKDEMEQKARAAGGSFYWLQTDITNEIEVKTALERITKEHNSIDVLVNNAGITKDGLIFRMKNEDWDSVIKTNLFSAFLLCREISRIMIKQRSGSIINVSSIVGLTGNGGQANYSASKAGLIGFSKSLARETASRGIRVNVVAPGFIDTEMTQKISQENKEKLAQNIPLGRTGRPNEIAEAILFLASEKASYITGQVLVVDGGMCM